jgi:hypothetical protein
MNYRLARHEGLQEVERDVVDESVSILVDMVEDTAWGQLILAPRYYRSLSHPARGV